MAKAKANIYRGGKFRNDFMPAKFEGNKEDDMSITSSAAINAAKQELAKVTADICKELDAIKSACDVLYKNNKSGIVIQRQTKNAGNHVTKVKTEFSNAVNRLNNALNEQLMTSWADYMSKDKQSAAGEAASKTVQDMDAV